jgi:DNA-binding HxlR family transcriptional regulator
VQDLFDKRTNEVIKLATPKPGSPVRGSQSGRPVMALLDLLGQRWMLRIIWELRDENLSFSELQSRCDSMSSSTLSLRLSELREAEIVSQDDRGGYALSQEGRELLNAFGPLNEWAQRWAARLKQGGIQG